MKKLLVPMDGSEIALRALSLAIKLARKFDSELIVLSIAIPYDRTVVLKADKNSSPDYVNAITLADPLDLAQKQADKEGYKNIAFREVIDLDPASCILEEADTEKVDMIIMGNRGLGVLDGFLLGSVSSKVVKAAGCPVVIVK